MGANNIFANTRGGLGTTGFNVAMANTNASAAGWSQPNRSLPLIDSPPLGEGGDPPPQAETASTPNTMARR